MFSINADQKKFRLFRIAQFNGRMATIKSGDSMVTGLVRGSGEESSVPPRWTITIVPIHPGQRPALLGPTPRSAPSPTIYC